MASMSTSATRVNPYLNFKFIVMWDNKAVAALSKVSPLKRSTEVIQFRQGGDPSRKISMPGITSYEAITLERGVTNDLEFQTWANKVWNYGSKTESSLKDYLKDITLQVLNEAGQVAIVYNIYSCWVSDYQA